MLERALSASQNGVMITDATSPDDPIVYVNRAFERLTGYVSEEAIGRNPRFLQGKDNDQPALDELRATREANNDDIEWTGVLRNYRKDGTLFYNELSAAAMHDENGRATNHVGIINDVTERKMLEDELAYRALHDPLTGLPNRSLFMERLTRAQERSDRRRGRVALLFLDLDRFKLVNDSLGHEGGDQLLVEAARRLRGCLRPGDTVARHGGDEFTVLLEGVRDPSDATSLAERIIEELRSPVVLDGRELFVTTSVGIAVSTHPREHPGDLLRQADAAMYHAKERGKDRYAMFEEATNTPRVLERVELEGALRRAPERGELRVHYQPKVDLETGRIVCVEALARWERPGHGLVLPSEFIPVAEETGMIVPLGRWVLEEACRQVREWQARYPDYSTLLASVNLSTRQFEHKDLVRDVARALEEAGLDPNILGLEITESVAMQDAEETVATFEELKNLGVKPIIDDFGTGYSSLSYLRRFPVDFLKIDRSFVAGLGEGLGDEVIVSGIIGLAHAMGIPLIAEGVETAEQLVRLRNLGCDQGQGNYFAEPLPSEEVGTLLETNPRW